MVDANAIVFPQDPGTGLVDAGNADFTSAGHFGGQAGVSNASDFVEEGLSPSVTRDGGNNPFVDLTAGTAHLLDESGAEVQDSNGDYNRTWDGPVSYAVNADAVSGVALADAAVNYVWLTVNPAEPNQAAVEANTSGDEPAAVSLLVALADTNDDTAVRRSTNPTAAFDEVASESFDLPSGASVGTESGDWVVFDSNGSVVLRWDEAAGEFVTDAINAAAVNTDDQTINQSLTDPNGTIHDSKLVSVEPWNIQPAYTSGPAHGEGGSAFQGAAPLPDGRVVLVPRDSSNVGLFDPSNDSYTSGPAHGEGASAFNGAAPLPDGRVVLAPRDSSNVGLSSPYTVAQWPGVANR